MIYRKLKLKWKRSNALIVTDCPQQTQRFVSIVVVP